VLCVLERTICKNKKVEKMNNKKGESKQELSLYKSKYYEMRDYISKKEYEFQQFLKEEKAKLRQEMTEKNAIIQYVLQIDKSESSLNNSKITTRGKKKPLHKTILPTPAFVKALKSETIESPA